MNILYRKDNGIVSLSPLQIKMGKATGLVALTQDELDKLKPQPIEVDNTQQIVDDCKRELSETDYKILKQIEQNSYTEEEYEAIKAHREYLRSEIRRLEEK